MPFVIGSCIQYQFEKYTGKLNVTIIVEVITIIEIIMMIVIIIIIIIIKIILALETGV